MAVSMPKIVLKNVTKLSLNDRFTAYRQQAQNAASVFRQKMQSQRQASVENRRLAQQMANRPTVIAALRIKRRSLQQRLGQKRKPVGAGGNSVKSRLDMRYSASRMEGRLGTPRSTRGRGQPQRGMNRGIRDFVRPGTSPLLKSRLGAPLENKFRSRPGQFYGTRNFGRGRQNNRNNFSSQPRRGAGGGTRGRRGNRSNLYGSWARKANNPVPTKQELDSQLDEYMAETKVALDQHALMQ